MSDSTNNVITSASSTSNHPALKAGDRIRSTLAGRMGAVVRTYDDGSASVCWDDGEPQAEGLGHERMPRCMLELVAASEDEFSNGYSTTTLPNQAGPVLPPTSSPLLSAEHANLTGSTAPENYPAVYTLLPGEFNGMPLSILRHDGRTWLIAEEIAAVLSDTPQKLAELEGIIGKVFDLNFPSGCYTKVRLASSILVVRLLDQRAVRFLGEALGSEFVDWFCGEAVPAGDPAAPVPLVNAKPAPTLQECIDQLAGVHFDVFKALRLVEAQVRGLGKLVENLDARDDDVANIAPLAEIAVSLVRPFDDLSERQGDIVYELKRRLFKNPEPDARLPESVWLDLVTELAAEHDGGFTNEQMSHLANIVDTMTHFGEDSPEVTAAWQIVRAYADRNGAVLYDHTYEGEAPGSGRVAFRWKRGMTPHLRQKAQETAPAH